MATLFFSYSHQDETLRNELEKHLTMLKREGLIEAWHDRRIPAGDGVDPSISAYLEAADIVLLLVSPDFLASTYCYDVEMTRALQRHERKECRVIPVILRPCDWHHAPFGQLLATPKDGKPITKWPNQDEAFLDVVQQIRAALPKAAPTPAPSFPANPRTPIAFFPRSSNMRIKQEFTEAQRDEFMDEAFEFMTGFFESSLDELQQRHAGIQTKFTRIDARSFGAIIYKSGKAVARCGIRYGNKRGFSSGITYSEDDSAPTNTMNEGLNVEAGDQELFLKPMGMFSYGTGTRETRLSQEGAAEYYWARLIKPLQG